MLGWENGHLTGVVNGQLLGTSRDFLEGGAPVTRSSQGGMSLLQAAESWSLYEVNGHVWLEEPMTAPSCHTS